MTVRGGRALERGRSLHCRPDVDDDQMEVTVEEISVVAEWRAFASAAVAPFIHVSGPNAGTRVPYALLEHSSRAETEKERFRVDIVRKPSKKI
eukprot:141498-Rhodomonas_salina.1